MQILELFGGSSVYFSATLSRWSSPTLLFAFPCDTNHTQFILFPAAMPIAATTTSMRLEDAVRPITKSAALIHSMHAIIS
jgi:hypothetical protein